MPTYRTSAVDAFNKRTKGDTPVDACYNTKAGYGHFSMKHFLIFAMDPQLAFVGMSFLHCSMCRVVHL